MVNGAHPIRSSHAKFGFSPTLAGVCVILALAGGAWAEAASGSRNCGSYNNGTKRWYASQYSPVGGDLVDNLTTRAVSCSFARSFTLRFFRELFASGHANVSNPQPGWRCRHFVFGGAADDFRCTASRGRVVHWQEAP